MLPATNRLRRSSDFSSIVGGGARVGTRTVVVHHRREVAPGSAAKVGFVVSKAVGSSVVRHRVSRRLRAIVAARLTTLPDKSGTVIRALPTAGSASTQTLTSDVERALGRVLAAASGR